MSEWISVEDDSLAYEVNVLFLFDSGEIITGWLESNPQGDHYCFGNHSILWDCDFHLRTVDELEVTHWMPLPQPPKVIL